MECRENCAACCIVISISSPIPGMPHGKPAGVACIHLSDELKCGLFNSPDRPAVCGGFMAEPLICGDSPQDAFSILSELENG
jgi:uncharacterized protein